MLVFFFTDIEGSSRLWEDHTEAMAPVIARHDQILREQVEAAGGRITKHTGDGITAVFDGGQPLICALEAQARFAAEPWGEIGELRIRAGLHAGEAEFHPSAGTPEGDYFGPPVNATARVMSAAWGGQILLTPEVVQASPLPPDATLLDLGQHLLKNVSAPLQLYQLLHPQLPHQEFPPPRTLSRRSIRQAVDERGAQMAGLEPQAMGVSLLVATLLPILQGELDPESGALEGNLGVLEDLGALSLRQFTADFAGRLRVRQPDSLAETEALLLRELMAQWQAGGETALALRSDASRLLQAVHGVEAAMTAASEEVKEALARGLAALGAQFGEFRWMLAGVQDTLAEMQARQELQLSLQREQLAKTEEILELQRERVRDPLAAYLPETEELPAFLEADEEPFEQPTFVARERELARLETFLHTALAGQGRVVFVVGGPGRGKTAVLNEFARRAMAADPNLLVASGSCNAFSGVGDPYLPFREVMGMLSGDIEARWRAGQITTQHAQRLWAALPHLAQALLGHGPHLLGTLVEGEALLARAAIAGEAGAPWQGALRDAVARRQTLPQGAATQGVEQSHLFEQYTNVLRRVCESHPLLLILDDVQWADSASIGLLFHFGRRLQGSPILVACAHRPEEVALGRDGERHPLEKVLAELKRLYGDVCLDLGREDKVEDQGFVDALLDTEPNELGGRFRQALYEHTAGHPLFAVELLRAMQERGDLIQDEAGRWVEGDSLDWGALPARVEAVIEERIGRLQSELRETLEVASVEGEDFSAQVVARVQAVQESRLLRQLSRELEKRHRLVREQGEERVGRRLLSRYRFAHHLFQRYVYNELGAGERRLLHHRVGEVLEELYKGRKGEIAVQLARHYAGDPEREQYYARLAGERAASQSANAEAIHYFSRALELAPETDCAERYALLLAREKVYDLQGAREAQIQDLASLSELANALDDDARRALVALRQANYSMVTGDLQATIEAAQEAIHLGRAAQDLGSEATGLFEWGRALWRLGDNLAARQRLQQALDLARAGECRQVEADTLRNLGNVCWLQRDLEGAMTYLEQALAIHREIGDRQGENSVLNSLGMVFRSRRDYATAKACYEQALSVSHETGDRYIEGMVLANLAGLSDRRGKFALARAYSEQALTIKREIGDREGEGETLSHIGSLALRQGDYAVARDCYEQSLLIFREIGVRHQQGWALQGLGWISRSQANYGMARNLFKESLSVFREIGSRVGEGWTWLSLGQVCTDLGDYTGATGYFEQSLHLSRELGGREIEGDALCSLGFLYHLLGDDRTAREYSEEALSIAQEVDDPPSQANAFTFLGHALVGLGYLEEADSAYRKALDLRRELGQPYLAMELLAGMARVSMALNDDSQALTQVEIILDHLAAGTLDGAYEPFRVYLTCYQVLRAIGDPRAGKILDTAHRLLRECAAGIEDEGLCRSFLQNVAANQEIVREWRRLGQ